MIQQLRDALGLRMEDPPAELVERLTAYAEHAGTVNPYAVGITAFTLLILAAWPQLSRKVPSPLVALLAGNGSGSAPPPAGGDDRHPLRRDPLVAALAGPAFDLLR